MDTILFTPLTIFTSEELQCVYVEGETYRIVPGNLKLLDLAIKWEGEEKIVFIEPRAEPSEGKVAGTGVVTLIDNTPQ